MTAEEAGVKLKAVRQDVSKDFFIFIKQFVEAIRGCYRGKNNQYLKLSKLLECLHPRIREKVEDGANTYEDMVYLAKVKSRKVKQKLELGMLKPVDYVPVATAAQITDAQGWEIDEESEQSQDGGQVLMEWQADEDADMESTYGDDGNGSSSFWETSIEESLETEFTSYSKEISFDECELVRVKLPSSVHEDVMVCNVNEDQVRGSFKKEDATLVIDEQQLDEAVVVKLPCVADEVDLFQSVIKMESDEARLCGYACSYKDGEVLDDMIQDEMVWDEFISSLSRDAETGHVQEEQVDEIATYGVGCEDMVIEDAASVELSKNMVDGPWDPEQVIFVEPEEEQAMDAGGLAKEVCALPLMEMLLDVAMQLDFRRLQESLQRISAIYGWEGGSNRLEEQDSEHDDALLEAERRPVDTWSGEGVLSAFYMHHCVFAWVEHYKRLLQDDGSSQDGGGDDDFDDGSDGDDDDDDDGDEDDGSSQDGVEMMILIM
ncbi:hypothetical protein L7F22_065463 [Adiantum nelumboides]|nr:hypothetical protein [Adiantum nelumboides]